MCPLHSFICCLCSQVHCKHRERQCPGVLCRTQIQWGLEWQDLVCSTCGQGWLSLEITETASLVLGQINDSPQNTLFGTLMRLSGLLEVTQEVCGKGVTWNLTSWATELCTLPLWDLPSLCCLADSAQIFQLSIFHEHNYCYIKDTAVFTSLASLSYSSINLSFSWFTASTLQIRLAAVSACKKQHINRTYS